MILYMSGTVMMYDHVIMDICHYTFVSGKECATPRVSPNANCGLLVIMMCPWRVISYNKWTTVVGDVDNQRGYACVGMGGSWEISGPSSQFCLEPQTVLNNKIY